MKRDVTTGNRRVAEDGFRNYVAREGDRVRDFYREQHKKQTVEFVREQRKRYEPLNRGRMGVWEAIEKLDLFVDASDPDTELSQLQHLLQTAEAIRSAGMPRWMVLTGLIHDLGKVLSLYGEPQWAVVGDTFPVGCRFSDRIIYHEFFEENPDRENPAFQSDCGIYREGVGLNEILMSWGHDEYLYQVMKSHLPEEALYVIRYHSFYAAHQEGAYGHLLSDRDRELSRWLKIFQPFDLYSKSDEPPDEEKLTPYYQTLVNDFLPAKLDW